MRRRPVSTRLFAKSTQQQLVAVQCVALHSNHAALAAAVTIVDPAPRGSRSATKSPAGSPKRSTGWRSAPGQSCFNIPLTAHFLGGAVIGDSPGHGVIDPYQRVYGYPTLYVADGAAISANLGVNPSLSITAQAERAASLMAQQG